MTPDEMNAASNGFGSAGWLALLLLLLVLMAALLPVLVRHRSVEVRLEWTLRSGELAAAIAVAAALLAGYCAWQTQQLRLGISRPLPTESPQGPQQPQSPDRDSLPSTGAKHAPSDPDGAARSGRAWPDASRFRARSPLRAGRDAHDQSPATRLFAVVTQEPSVSPHSQALESSCPCTYSRTLRSSDLRLSWLANDEAQAPRR